MNSHCIFADYSSENNENWSKILIEAYLNLDEKLLINDFFLLHGVDITGNKLCCVLLQIIKHQYVVLTNALLLTLISESGDELVWHILCPELHMPRKNHPNDSRIIGMRYFEQVISQIVCRSNSGVVSLYFILKDLYCQYGHYEQAWQLRRLHSLIQEQAAKLDDLSRLFKEKYHREIEDHYPYPMVQNSARKNKPEWAFETPLLPTPLQSTSPLISSVHLLPQDGLGTQAGSYQPEIPISMCQPPNITNNLLLFPSSPLPISNAEIMTNERLPEVNLASLSNQ